MVLAYSGAFRFPRSRPPRPRSPGTAGRAFCLLNRSARPTSRRNACTPRQGGRNGRRMAPVRAGSATLARSPASRSQQLTFPLRARGEWRFSLGVGVRSSRVRVAQDEKREAGSRRVAGPPLSIERARLAGRSQVLSLTSVGKQAQHAIDRDGFCIALAAVPTVRAHRMPYVLKAFR